MGGFRMLDLPVPQAATRLAALLPAPESKTLDFKRNGEGYVAGHRLRRTHGN